MKKLKVLIVTLGLVGIFWSSQYAEAEVIEQQLSVEKITPRATPDIRTVTLKTGESFTFNKIGFSIDGFRTAAWFQVATENGDKETYSMTGGGDLDTSMEMYFYNNFQTTGHTLTYKDENIVGRVPRPFYFRLTNYSSGAVTYKVGVNTGINVPFPELKFDF